MELDLYIPSLRIAIEYDGYQWHHNKLALDERPWLIKPNREELEELVAALMFGGEGE